MHDYLLLNIIKSLLKNSIKKGEKKWQKCGKSLALMEK